MIAGLALLAVISTAAPRPILVWHPYSGAEEKALEQVVGAFEAQHPEFKVELLSIPFDAYPSKLTSAIPTGHGPDLFIYPGQDRLGGWAREGYIAPLDADAAAVAPDVFPAALQALRFEGHTYGLPMVLKSAALYYNEALVPQPPRTTDELVALARKLTDRSEQRYGLAYEAGNFYYHAAWLHGFGGSIFREPGHQVELDTRQAPTPLEFVRGLTVVDPVVPPETTGTLVATLFNQGKAAMVISGPWFGADVRGVKYGVTTLPAVSATGKPAMPLLGVECAMLSATARDAAGASAFARFLVSREAAVVRATVGEQVVATRSAYDDPRVAADPLLSGFRSQAEQAVPMDNSPAMGEVWEPEKRALNAVITGELGPAEALAKADREMRAISRPAPPARSPLPYLLALVLALAGAAAYVRRRLRQPRPPLPATFEVGAKAYAYVAPAAAGMLVLVFIPFAAGIGLAFFHHQEGQYTFVGLHNFVSILTSPDYRLTEPMNFYFTLGVTLLWTVVNVTAHVSIGLCLALVLKDPLLRLKGVYRVLLIVPWAVPNYITALIWKGMFNREFGAISALLRALHLQPIAWFTHFSTAFAADVVTNTWLGFPFMMVVTLGALQSIPTDLYEAAEVDGASRWAQFRHITLPLLRPALLPALILGSVWTFNMFNIIYLVSGGDPGGSTDILVSQAYRWAFERNEQFGFAAAYSTLIFIFLLGYSALTRKVGKDPALEAA